MINTNKLSENNTNNNKLMIKQKTKIMNTILKTTLTSLIMLLIVLDLKSALACSVALSPAKIYLNQQNNFTSQFRVINTNSRSVRVRIVEVGNLNNIIIGDQSSEQNTILRPNSYKTITVKARDCFETTLLKVTTSCDSKTESFMIKPSVAIRVHCENCKVLCSKNKLLSNKQKNIHNQNNRLNKVIKNRTNNKKSKTNHFSNYSTNKKIDDKEPNKIVGFSIMFSIVTSGLFLFKGREIIPTLKTILK